MRRHPSIPELRAQVARACATMALLWALVWVGLPWVHLERVHAMDSIGLWHEGPPADLIPLTALWMGVSGGPRALAVVALLGWIVGLVAGSSLAWSRGRARWLAPPLLVCAAACAAIAPGAVALSHKVWRFGAPGVVFETLWPAYAAVLGTLLLAGVAIHVARRRPISDVDLTDLRPRFRSG